MKNETKTVKEIKQEFERLIEKNKFGSAFSNIKKLLSDDEDRGEIVSLTAQWKATEKDNRKNNISRDDYRREINLVRDSFIQFVNELEADDLDLREHEKETIQEEILVVCKEERKVIMEKFFSTYYFKNIEYLTFEEGISNIAGCDLVILDMNYFTLGRGAPYPQEEYAILEETLQQSKSTNAHFLYFGSSHIPDELTKRFADIAYFSNSVFSLYARIKEMLEFRKYYQD